MVSSSSVYPFQTGSPVVEWVSPAAHGLVFDCGSGLEKQVVAGLAAVSTLSEDGSNFQTGAPWCD